MILAINARYINYPITTDARDLIQRAFDYLQLKIPGWQPSEGQLDVWMIEAISAEAADIATLTTQVPKTIFRYFGAAIFGVLPEDAVSAIVYTTWIFNDTDPHVITAGTQVGIRDSAGVLWPFQVLNDVDIAGGVGQTTTGQVLMFAAVQGASSSGLGSAGATMEIIDTLPWVSQVTQVNASTGGVDAETDDQYLSRLTRILQAMSPRPILPRDFAILARNIAGVQRAAVVDLYNPADSTFNNERMVTVVPVGADGQPVTVLAKAALAAYLESMREVNFVVNVIDPIMNRIAVNISVLALPGYGEVDVDDRITAAVEGFLAPTNWGVSPLGDNPNDPVTWNNEVTIYYLDLAHVVKSVAGVERINSLTLGAYGGVLASADYTLNGVVPLPFTNPGDVNVAVVTQ